MKIEMGESIVYSWLKHCKGCGIVQLNWKPSPSSVKDHDKRVLDLMASAQEMFKNIPNLFKKNKPCQLVKQCEVDVLGYNFQDKTLYASEVAFHESGLSYKNVKESVRRVIAKMIRSAIALQEIFPGVHAQIIFISPKVGNNIGELLKQNFEKINTFSVKQKLNCRFAFVINEDFRTEIFEPVCKVSLEVADTSELFMRSLKLAKIFGEYGPFNSTRSKVVSPTGGPKIGKLIQSTFIQLFKQHKISKDMLRLLQDKAYSRNNFKVSFSVVKNVTDSDFPNIQKRYWKVRVGQNYAVCSQWTEKHRPFFKVWLEQNFKDFPGRL